MTLLVQSLARLAAAHPGRDRPTLADAVALALAKSLGVNLIRTDPDTLERKALNGPLTR